MTRLCLLVCYYLIDDQSSQSILYAETDNQRVILHPSLLKNAPILCILYLQIAANCLQSQGSNSRFQFQKELQFSPVRRAIMRVTKGAYGKGSNPTRTKYDWLMPIRQPSTDSDPIQREAESIEHETLEGSESATGPLAPSNRAAKASYLSVVTGGRPWTGWGGCSRSMACRFRNV